MGNKTETINEKILPDATTRIVFLVAMQFQVRGTSDERKFRTESKNLASNMVPSMFEDLRVHIDGDYIELASDDEGGWRVTASYKWKHFDDGSNGCTIATLWYDESGEFQDMRSDFATTEFFS